MLRIRLSRIGKRKKPMYRLIVSEKARDTYGRALEILGSYNPFTKEVDIKKDRIEHWLKQGAKMSATVNNLLVNKEIVKGEKVRSFIPKKKKTESEEAKAEGEKSQPKEEKPAQAKPEDKEEAKDEKPAEEAKEKKTEDKPKETKEKAK